MRIVGLSLTKGHERTTRTKTRAKFHRVEVFSTDPLEMDLLLVVLDADTLDETT